MNVTNLDQDSLLMAIIHHGPEIQCLLKVKEDLSLVLIF